MLYQLKYEGNVGVVDLISVMNAHSALNYETTCTLDIAALPSFFTLHMSSMSASSTMVAVYMCSSSSPRDEEQRSILSLGIA